MWSGRSGKPLGVPRRHLAFEMMRSQLWKEEGQWRLRSGFRCCQAGQVGQAGWRSSPGSSRQFFVRLAQDAADGKPDRAFRLHPFRLCDRGARGVGTGARRLRLLQRRLRREVGRSAGAFRRGRSSFGHCGWVKLHFSFFVGRNWLPLGQLSGRMCECVLFKRSVHVFRSI